MNEVLKNCYLEEDLFPKLFTKFEERPYGILFYNPENRDSYDSNHAVIYRDKIDDLPAVLKDIREFYKAKGSNAIIYQSMLDDAYFEEIKSDLFATGFKSWSEEQKYMLPLEENKLTPPENITVRRVGRAVFQTEEDFLRETKCIDFSHPLIAKKIAELKSKSPTEIDYIKNAYEFVRDENTHSWDVRATVVSKTASEVLQNGTGICWAKSCLLAALLRGNKIPCGITYQKLTRADDASDGYIIHALNTVYISSLKKWIRLDARGNKATVHAKFSIDEEKLAFPVRAELNEVDYLNNDVDLDERLVKILDEVDVVMNIRTDFELY